MNEDDIPRMTMYNDGAQVPLPRFWIRIIGSLKRLIWENIECRVPGAELASMYSSKMFHEYIHDIRLKTLGTARTADFCSSKGRNN